MTNTGRSVQGMEQSMCSAGRQVSSTKQFVNGAKCEKLEPATRDVLPQIYSPHLSKWGLLFL